MTPLLTLGLGIAADAGIEQVGGKGLNLSRLLRLGFRVPSGFVVTTAAYHRPDDPAIAEAILSHYSGMTGPVAVRSSATAEDLEDASFAGQQETFLNVTGEEALLQAVRDCWASLHSERAVAYRRAQGITTEPAMAVVVQEMVPADAAGVLFTRDPTGAEPERMVVEAVAGLGEALVSGRVSPSRWTLDRETGVADLGELRDTACAALLTRGVFAELAAVGRKAEAAFEAPQDIEWALAGGQLYVLQSRPITTTAGEREAVRREEIETLRRRAEPDGTVWARYSLAEVLPEPLPLTWALWRQFMSGGGGYGRMYRELGYDPDPCLKEDGVLDLIAGRPYFNLSRDARLYFHGFPYDYPFAKLKADPDRAMYPTPEPNLQKAPKGFILKSIGITRRMLAAEKTLEQAAEQLPGQLEQAEYPRVRALAAEWRERSLESLGDAALVEAFAEARHALFDEHLPQLLKPSVLAGLAIEKLRGELRPLLPEGAANAAVDALLAGVHPAPEYDLAAALRRLACGELDRATFLEGFGHRGPGEMELASPRWRELPELPVAAGGVALLRQTTPVEELGAVLERFGARRPASRRAEQYLERARRMTAIREASKHLLMLGYEVLRRLLLELDRRRGLHGGVFFLEPEELPRAAAGEDLRPEIARRRRRRATALGLEAPRVLFSDDLEALGRPLPAPPGGDELSGTGVSPGSAEGEALVLRRPEQAPAGAQGFILVCPSTDPGWVPLFLRARGVVLETGGVLSHGAIVARELGLPAVANVPDACSRLRTGDRLRVDGAAGRVWRLPGTPDG